MEYAIIEEIRSLKGDTLGHIFKKFSSYVIDNIDFISSNVDKILSSFIPQNNLQKLLRLCLIDKFQKTSEIRKILEEEDIFYTKRALNCKWFFTNLDVNPTVLVNEVFPLLSYSIRYKIIKKYSKYLKDVNKAEDMYRALQHRYGVECAINILPACSPTFVKVTLCSSIGQIKPIIIEPLFRKFPDVIVDFFSYILNCKSSENRLYHSFNFDKYSNVFVKIASKYPERFIDMYTQYGEYFPYMTLGNRTAKRIIQTNPSVIITQWDSFQRILKLKETKKYMDASQIEKLQLSYFPEKLMEFFEAHWKMEEIRIITSHLGEEKGQEIFLRNFKKRYNKELNVDEFAKVMSLSLIQLLPTEMRIKWVQRELPSLETDNKKAEYLSYLPPDIALPELKKLIVKQNDFLGRAHFVKCMIISSCRYKSSTSLVDCLSYVLRRLRNDNIRLRENVFNELINWKELLRSLSIEGWSLIDELIDLVRMNDEEINFRYYICELFSLKIKLFFSKGIPMEEHLQKFFDFMTSFESYLDFELCKGTIYRKQCLEFFLRSYPSLTIKKEEDKAYSDVTLFCALCEYNHLHKNDKLEYPEWLLVSIEKILLSDLLHYYNTTNLTKALRTQPHLKERMYLKTFPQIIDLNCILYILHKRPMLIKEHNEKLMKHILKLSPYAMKEYITFFKQITLHTSFNLLQTELNFCINILQTDELLDSEDCYSRQNAVSVLSVFMSAEEFIQIISPYKPTKEELESYTNENRLQYRIQQSVAESFKFVNTPSKILSYIKSFAVGDYLKLVVGSINSISLKVAEKEILPMLIEWLDCRVSLRKHFIRAYYRIAPVADSGKLIVSLLSKEKNVSLRLLLLEHIYKYFLAEPSEESFAVFKAGYSQLTPEDDAAVDRLFDLKRIPDSFVPLFVKMLWEAVELKESLLVVKNKNKIINMLDADTLSLLSEEFCDVLLKHAFSSVSSTENRNLIALYLLHASDEHSQMCRLEKCKLYLKQMVEHWNDFDLKRSAVFQTRDNVFNLIENICDLSMKKEKLQVNPKLLLEKLKSSVLSLVSAFDVVEQLLRLDITIFIMSNSSENDDFVTQLAKFFEENLIKEVSIYGDQIIETMFHVMPYYLEPYRLQLAKILFCEHSPYQVHLFALKLIHTDIVGDLPTYQIIVDFLLKCDHPSVKAAAGGFLRNLTSNVHVS